MAWARAEGVAVSLLPRQGGEAEAGVKGVAVSLQLRLGRGGGRGGKDRVRGWQGRGWRGGGARGQGQGERVAGSGVRSGGEGLMQLTWAGDGRHLPLQPYIHPAHQGQHLVSHLPLQPCTSPTAPGCLRTCTPRTLPTRANTS